MANYKTFTGLLPYFHEEAQSRFGDFFRAIVYKPETIAAQTAALTTVTHTAPGTPDYAIQNLTNSSPYGFVSQDEGNTVLSVIANLQARVTQLETALQNAGLAR